MRALGIIACLLLAGFCIFGFLASFEPSPQAIYFRVGYAAIGVAAIAGTVTLLRKK